MNLDAKVKQDLEAIEKLAQRFSGFKQGEAKLIEVIKYRFFNVKTYTSTQGHTFEVTSFEKEGS